SYQDQKGREDEDERIRRKRKETNLLIRAVQKIFTQKAHVGEAGLAPK
ncbi:unnamed protein product, partial [Arabidopsis halleri]